MMFAIENLTQQFKDVSTDVLAIKTDLNTKASTGEVAVLNTNIQSLFQCPVRALAMILSN